MNKIVFVYSNLFYSHQHKGTGLDLRARKVWAKYPPSTKLMEFCVTPDNLSPLEGATWLLGNHCDELTPWIPIMAAKCGKPPNIWLLPCCRLTFIKKKY